MLKQFKCCTHLFLSIYRYGMEYDQKYRALYCYVFDKELDEYTKQIMYHCPYCGTRLPKNLLTGDGTDDPDIRSNVLAKELNKKYEEINECEIPFEFQTDAWWKKRGL